MGRPSHACEHDWHPSFCPTCRPEAEAHLDSQRDESFNRAPVANEDIEQIEAAARERGRKEERAAIVSMYRARAARLRKRALICKTVGSQWDAEQRAMLWEGEADAIERGAHQKGGRG